MNGSITKELGRLGLSPAEAQVYVALARHGSLSVSAIAAATGCARTGLYPTLNSLAKKGLVDAGKGYGSRFSAVPAEQALPGLMAADKQALVQRERLTTETIKKIASATDNGESAAAELIHVINSPRAVAERFDRLEAEAKQQIDVFVKPPFFTARGNPGHAAAVRHRVHCRGLFEKGALEDPVVKPYLADWLASAQEARVFDGELPHKMAIFDSRVALMPLITAGEQMRALLIRNTQLALSLTLAFDYIWDRAKPVSGMSEKKKTTNLFHKTRQKELSRSDPNRFGKKLTATMTTPPVPAIRMPVTASPATPFISARRAIR